MPTVPIAVGARRVGPGEPCLVIAEAGVNHDGDPALAHRLVDVAAAAGADAVKFQTFRPEGLVSDEAAAAPYQRRSGAVSQREMLARLTLPESAWAELAAHAGERGLLFLSTAFDLASLDLLLAVGVSALKAPSGELDNLPFLAELARRGLPLLVSTGMGTLDEVAAAVDAAAAAPGLALLHCVTAYPAPVEESNLLAIPAMAGRFGVPVGWSDHTEGSVTAVAAVALGAAVLEKHFTTDRRRPGPDHAASAEPDELAAYVAAVRAAEASLGDGIKRPVPSERENLRFARRSHHAARELAPGETIAAADVALLRPADGLPPAAKVVGRVVARPVAAGRPLCAEDLE
ncbi:MAG TPA: N-acetylneuraminate synthase family protein [Thermoanaerobaculia bacterium]|nr:N-acetylneuraminate synthase family protein [Thermoanaerobaculia bacterium]